MAGVKWLWLFTAVYQGSQDICRHASETLADEAIQEEVDSGVEECQHVCYISEDVEETASTLRDWGR